MCRKKEKINLRFVLVFITCCYNVSFPRFVLVFITCCYNVSFPCSYCDMCNPLFCLSVFFVVFFLLVVSVAAKIMYNMCCHYSVACRSQWPKGLTV